jgi:hypothetical protein
MTPCQVPRERNLRPLLDTESYSSYPFPMSDSTIDYSDRRGIRVTLSSGDTYFISYLGRGIEWVMEESRFITIAYLIHREKHPLPDGPWNKQMEASPDA